MGRSETRGKARDRADPGAASPGTGRTDPSAAAPSETGRTDPSAAAPSETSRTDPSAAAPSETSRTESGPAPSETSRTESGAAPSETSRTESGPAPSEASRTESGAAPSETSRSESGSTSLEVVMLVPVLMLLALFVLWGGPRRPGRAPRRPGRGGGGHRGRAGLRGREARGVRGAGGRRAVVAAGAGLPVHRRPPPQRLRRSRGVAVHPVRTAGPARRHARPARGDRGGAVRRGVRVRDRRRGGATGGRVPDGDVLWPGHGGRHPAGPAQSHAQRQQ